MTDAAVPLMRRLRKNDAERLGTFFDRNNRPEVTIFFRAFPLNKNMARDLLKPESKNLFFVMEEEGKFLAFSMLRGYDEGYETPSFGIFVDWEHQQRGIGRRLSEWTFRWADQTGTAEIRLTVYEQNIHARKIYEQLGFAETDHKHNTDGRVSVIMHRQRPLNKTKVFASTQALPSSGETLPQRFERWHDAGIQCIELSSYDIDKETDFLKDASHFGGELLIHHFFPSNRKDLVLNLASADSTCRHDTLLFFKRAIEWSAKISAPYFSIHAGYITDPIGRDMEGFVLAEPTPGAYDAAWDHFSTETEILAKISSELGIRLLIENNVVSRENEGKLLLAKPDEFIRFFSQPTLSGTIGILLDWGHWLVSAKTYRLDLDAFLPLSDSIDGMHLHMNHGSSDEHLPLPPDDNQMDLVKQFNPKFVSLEGHYPSISALQHDILQMEKALS